LVRLLADGRVWVGGRFAKLLDRASNVAFTSEHRTKVDACFAKVRADIDGAAVLLQCLGGVSALFEEAA
jgi:hypothetical protein